MPFSWAYWIVPVATTREAGAQEQPRFVDEATGTYQPYQPSILERDVNVYLISESELDEISSANPLVILFASAFFSLVATASAFWVAGETAGENVSERTEAIFDVVPIVAGIAAFLCLTAAAVLWLSGQSMLKRIRRESRRPAHLVAPRCADEPG